MRYIASYDTLAVLSHVEEMLQITHFDIKLRRDTHFYERELSRNFPRTRELSTLRGRLLLANEILDDPGIGRMPLYSEEDASRFSWMYYLEEINVIPVYDDAIAVMRQHRLVEANEVPALLRFISVGGSNYGVDKAENHNFGYHFHFGKVKSSKLKRCNLIFTFDKRMPKPSGKGAHDPLFAEEHGSGSYDHIDESTIGKNVRYPIYKICEGEMLKLGRENFKEPSNMANVFY